MNLNDVEISIEAMLEGAEATRTDACCIYRVPFDIRKLNEDAYTPKVVSIGPFHHDYHSRLSNMERHKQIYCKAFLTRSQTSLKTWIRYIEEAEPQIRRCYSDTLYFSKEELVKIIIVDCGFIFELFCITYDDQWSGNDTFLKPWLTTKIRQDLLLLENQLPFFVLEDLFNLSYPSGSATGNEKIPTFIELTFDYFDYYNRSKLHPHNVSIRHFTDLIRTFHLQHPKQGRSRWTRKVMRLYSATELSEAGVRIKASVSECLLDLKFSGRVLEIPRLLVGDVTELLFRNMLALEQCHYPYESYITDYVVVLGVIGKTSRDVGILSRFGVLMNFLGNNDRVAAMFNDLVTTTTVVNFNDSYISLCLDLDIFCSNRWHRWMAALRRWQGVASVGGIVILILTLCQTVCSVLQVVPLKK